MNLPAELASFSRHLMLFLVAVFAFTSKSVVDSGSQVAIGLLVTSLIVAFLSFTMGYSAFFRLFNDEKDRVTGRVPAREGLVTPHAIRKVQVQYYMTMAALALTISAIIVALFERRFVP